jgi:OOP family OmpA-OmpF porin
MAAGALAMRSTLMVLIGFFVLAALTAAQANPQGWYLGLGGGWTALESVGYVLASPAGPRQARLEFGDNGTFAASAGYRFPGPLRVEAEFGFADYRAKFLHAAGLPDSPLSGGMSTVSFITNAAYDIPLSPLLALSLGLGLGISEVDPSIRDPAGSHLHNPQAVFAWRVGAGVAAKISDNVELELDYRYQEIGGSSHTFFAGQTMPVEFGAKHAHFALINLRWYVASSSPPEPLNTAALPFIPTGAAAPIAPPRST